MVQQAAFARELAAVNLFQYSLTNLVWCNRRNFRANRSGLWVSVFSDESRVVQLSTVVPAAGRGTVSVFSDESRVVQHILQPTAKIRQAVSVFSDESRVVQQTRNSGLASAGISFSIL